MTTVTVLAVGGTGESFPDDPRTDVTGLLAGVTDRLDDRFWSRWVGYPSSYGPVPVRQGMSFAASVAVGAAELLSVIAETPGPIMLIGYSQGCVVVREALDADGVDPSDVARVIGIGLVADPHQPPGVVDGCAGSGVAGPGRDLPDGVATLWIADPADMICNADADSLVRDVADLTGALSLGDLVGWLRRTWETLRRNAFQNAARTSIRPRQWRRDLTRLRRLVLDVLGYLPALIVIGGLRVRNRRGGRHTAYASEPLGGRGDHPGVVVLAKWLQVQATFATGMTSDAA
ncbi:PE-PPE domain-containing protein [Williamsia phyllosphaerae]|uniref:PE-PPE domain-containing protein n=1 Tax=Williamsia phyllosphaerae TaxID=885042 RepID=A0ABQ1V6Z4_9NOCA|nr:PE-PPE domain-containing protein [Williamsia phyllosphaerae]GGF38746.1 hypothetical protein GCM10007298_38050 [Williamsia phyllosphaerae]